MKSIANLISVALAEKEETQGKKTEPPPIKQPYEYLATNVANPNCNRIISAPSQLILIKSGQLRSHPTGRTGARDKNVQGVINGQ